MTTKTLPKSIRTKALRYIAKMTAWNGAIYRARSQDIREGTPGRHEYRVRTDKAHIPVRLGWSQSAYALDQLEATLSAQGWTPEDLYAALGAVRPAVEPEGPHVVDWFEGQR